MVGLRLILVLAFVLSFSLQACSTSRRDGHHHRSGSKGEVTLCHKGKKTLVLPRSAADAHLGHGDRWGRCY